MIDILLSAAVLLAGGVAYTLYAASRAPMGCQNAGGFHYGPGSEPESVSDFHGTPVPELSR